MTEVEVTIKEILESHPKSCEIITDYFMSMMIDSFNDEAVPEEFKTTMREAGISKERFGSNRPG